MKTDPSPQGLMAKSSTLLQKISQDFKLKLRQMQKKKARQLCLLLSE